MIQKSRLLYQQLSHQRLRYRALKAAFSAVFRAFFIVGLHFGTCGLKAQPLTFYRDIQPILLRHCAPCHQPGQVGPFSLLRYEEVEKRATFIKKVVSARYMPPWLADPSFQTYHNQRILSEADIQKIVDWVDQGKKEGKASKGMDIADFLKDSLRLPQPNLTLEMNQAFVIPGNNTEQYRMFVIPTNLPEDVYVRGIEFVPGNRRLAHHARIMVDTTRLLREDDGLDVGPSAEFDEKNVKVYDSFWQGWVPGNTPAFYPEGMAKKLPKQSDLVINMHYSPSPVEATDRSKIRLYLAPTPPKHTVKSFVLGENWITNLPFFLPANTVNTFYMRSPMTPVHFRLLSVLPHMHKLGKSFKAYAITPDGDLVPLVKIDRWDFNWQTTYQFVQPLDLPKGSVIYAEAVFDNTAANPENPSFPPKDVTYGWGTNNEMMNLIVEYVEK